MVPCIIQLRSNCHFKHNTSFVNVNLNPCKSLLFCKQKNEVIVLRGNSDIKFSAIIVNERVLTYNI